MGRPRKIPIIEEKEIAEIDESLQLCNLRNMYDHFFKTLWKLKMDLDEMKWQVRLQPVDDQASAAVARIHDDLQGL